MRPRKLDALKESFYFYLRVLCASYGWSRDDIVFKGEVLNKRTGEKTYVNWEKP